MDKNRELVDARPIQPSSVVYAVPVYAGSAYTEPGVNGAGQASEGNSVNQVQAVQVPYASYPGQNTAALPQATVVALIQTSQFGGEAARIICPFCGSDVVTEVKITPSITAHLWALGLCVFGCVPCCIAPYFVRECQSHIHVCPSCNHEVGYHGL